MYAFKLCKPLFLSLSAAMALGACATAQDVSKPDVIAFGETSAAMTDVLQAHCAEQNLREVDPPSMPGVSSQVQIDCKGFPYFGARRLAEFVFADDALTLVWILTEKSEEDALIAAFKDQYGAPSHDTPMFTAFADYRVAVRKDIPEALYYAPQAAEAFRTWFDQQAMQE